MITFRHLATAASFLLLVLAIVWFAWPQWILTHWEVAYNYGAGFQSRRMACFFLAVAVILWSVRQTHSAEARRAVINGMAAACVSLIMLGLWEYMSGHAGRGIFFAIGLESLILATFLTVDRQTLPGREAPREPTAPAR